ncbi:MAG: MBL fold metallo-hydrolase [Chloroflexi bacterium]|nr:MBL fold metallo-hydrolase [Chloroflexota bacterium]
MVPEEFQLGHLKIVKFELGLAMTNTYLLGDPDTKSAIVIDPAWDGEQIAGAALDRGWQIKAIWLTHAHFDHFGGVSGIVKSIGTPIPVALHPLDFPLWQTNGDAGYFGITEFESGPEPTIDLETGMELTLGIYRFEVRHTPGHSLGHVIFVSEGLGAVFCGDLIFSGSVGRTDLQGGDWNALLQSIREEILVLSDETRLFTGHGPPTTVGKERRSNPFITGEIQQSDLL